MLRRATPLLLALVALSGCALGERPTLEAADVITDSATQTVAERLERSPVVDFTATYSITPSSSTDSTVATITSEGGTVTTQIGDVTYTTDPAGNTTTCRADDCTDGANDAYVSNLGITHRFWESSARQRLVTDAARRIGTSTGTTDTIAGQSAVCVAIKLPSSVEAVGTVSYCALDQGMLARYIGADGTIELTSLDVAPTVADS
ncbi:MAG: hypothetical protein RIB65_18715 [Ilumatobacter fluminis]|uniref:Lipoprotein n=1 Tax=Ilumatobacter fluminis TaxID=467091 RepID=A0A4R7HZW6_9ACTN|nr:hypothetical protein [Ilumatobacter fluminis]TDT16099.1 hypothetical protein BDK89_1681 [Ilumatobacter fluminis]